ncbi:MAG: aminotransferase class V-fold PLP-dependent enzyme [Melioribacteraceae bacterium]|nr:aminotransferase class V-fold PLP-dependent enzyme [Melioribacteraceae bacterium]MCF8263693.1 aminotransferase class V-fold PLP-dependent enzyme [Melioribacteraceae bacterium]
MQNNSIIKGNIESVRKIFPHIRKGKIYFNHAAIGPLSKLVVNDLEKYLSERSFGTIKNYDHYLKIASELKSRLAHVFNTDPKRFALVENVAFGMNTLANGLNWNVGDHIILNDLEFPSNVYPFLNLKNQGVNIELVKSTDGKVSVQSIEEKITDRTKLISISAVQFLTGYRADLQKIGEVCKRNNIVFAVDSIQAAGAVNIDIPKCNIDFLTGGSQKWLMGLQGASFFYISEELQSKMEQKFVGWNSYKSAWELINYDEVLKPDAERFQNGTLNVIGFTAFNSSLSMFLEFGLDNIEKIILNNTDYFIKTFNGIGISPLLNGVDQKNLSGIISVRINNADQIKSALEKQNIFVEVREGLLRISPHFYNTRDEIDRVIKEIAALV